MTECCGAWKIHKETNVCVCSMTIKSKQIKEEGMGEEGACEDI